MPLLSITPREGKYPLPSHNKQDFPESDHYHMGFLYFFSSSIIPREAGRYNISADVFVFSGAPLPDSFGAFIQLNRPGPWNTGSQSSQSGKEVFGVPWSPKRKLHPCCYWSWCFGSLCLKVFLRWHGFTRTPQQRRNAWAKPVGQAKTPSSTYPLLGFTWCFVWYSGWGFHCGMAGYSCRVFPVWGTQWNTAGIWSQHYKRLPTVMLPFEICLVGLSSCKSLCQMHKCGAPIQNHATSIQQTLQQFPPCIVVPIVSADSEWVPTP